MHNPKRITFRVKRGWPSIYKNLLVYFGSSMVAVLITVALQFLLPKLISVEAYGMYKTFTLYLAFTSLLHFGLKDGIYLRLSEQETINLRENHLYFTTMILQQLLVFMVMVLLSVLFSGVMRIFLLAIASSSFFFIMNTYFEAIFQSRKNFRMVSFQKVFKEGFFLLNVIAIFYIFKDLKIEWLLGLYVLATLVTFCTYILKAGPLIRFQVPVRSEITMVLAPVYKRGANLLIGNFGNQINSNIDKLFVSSFFSVSAFAYYSFGGMFFVLVNTFVGSVATVLLPYLLTDFKENLPNTYSGLLRISTAFGVLLFLYVLLVMWLVIQFYEEYLSSIPVIAMFFGAMVYNVKINVVQNNYLKTLGLDRTYIWNNYLILAVFLGTMFLLHAQGLDLEYFALSTSLFVYARFRLNERAIRRALRIKTSRWKEDSVIWLLAILAYVISLNLYQ